MPTSISLDELIDAIELVSSGMGEFTGYVSRIDGSTHVDTAGVSDEVLPDDIDDGSKYIRLPDKRDLDVGQHLLHEFVRERMPGDIGAVHAMFQRRGGYRRAKDLMERRGLLDAWYAYELERTAAAIAEWAQQQGFQVDVPAQTAPVPGRE